MELLRKPKNEEDRLITMKVVGFFFYLMSERVLVYAIIICERVSLESWQIFEAL